MKNVLLGLALLVTTAAAEPNASGDIPDTQAFVTYHGAGYSVLVPEGWARTQRGAAVIFTWSADGEAVDTAVSGNAAATLHARYGAQGAVTMRSTTLGGSKVVVATFTSQSKPDPVTGKTVRLDDRAYLFSGHGRRALLVLWAPAGSDNADQWKKIAESFRWS
jgi:hypothetical protein